MKELDALKIFFNVYQHVSDKEYNAKDGDYERILKHHKQKFDKFCSQNKYNVQKYLKYSKRNITLIAILNNLKSKSFEIQEDLNLKKFYDSLIHYQNNMNREVEYVYNNLHSIDDLYKMFIEDDIHFYTFFGLIKYLKFDKKKYLGANDMFLKKVAHQKRIGTLLNFNDDITKTFYFDDLQKKISLTID